MTGAIDRSFSGDIASAPKGDEIAFGRIVAAFHAGMHRVCVFVCGDQSVAEDGAVVIDRVVAARPGFLALQLDDDGEPDAVTYDAPQPDDEVITLRYFKIAKGGFARFNELSVDGVWP